ncbi:MAG: IPTL-CTERM sorting domain-containing protein [Acidobacteriota bacterium]
MSPIRTPQEPKSRQQRRALARSQRKTERRPSGAGTAAAGAAFALGAMALGQPASALTFTVTNTNDTGLGSLRQAVSDANGAVGPDVVVFQSGVTGTILLDGQIDITDAVDIQGPGEAVVTVDGNNASRVFYIYSTAAPAISVTISGLTVAHGYDPNFGGGIVNFGENLALDHVTLDTNSAGDGGGGLASGGATSQLTITHSTFTGNSAYTRGGGLYFYDSGAPTLIQDSVFTGNDAPGGDSGPGRGGGMYFYGPSYDVTIERTTIANNTATKGGGIYFYDTDGGTVTIRQSTLSGNSAAVGGGAYFYAIDDPVVIENSTISGNTGYYDGGGLFFYVARTGTEIRNSTITNNDSPNGEGGGIYFYYGSASNISLKNTIVAGNTASAGNDLAGDGAFDLDHSLIQDTTGASTNDLGGNVFGMDPLLGPLANNGGTTQTHLPGAGSPALDVATATGAPAVDQRGITRPQGPGIDIGAVEVVVGVPGTVQFTVASVSNLESVTTVVLDVSRTGGASGAISVQFNSANGSATQPSDYATATGTLNWADQDAANKTITLTIVNDTVVEPDEAFTVTLSGPTGGATVGAIGTETVNILNDDVVSIAQVPTLGEYGELLLVGLLGAGGVLLVRRRRKLAAPVIALTLAIGGASAMSAAHDGHGGHGAKDLHAGSVTQVKVSGAMATLKLSDGSSTVVPLGTVEIVDRRHGHHNAAARPVPNLAALPTGSSAVIKVKHNADGSIKKVRVVLFDTLAKAQAALAKKNQE